MNMLVKLLYINILGNESHEINKIYTEIFGEKLKYTRTGECQTICRVLGIDVLPEVEKNEP